MRGNKLVLLFLLASGIFFSLFLFNFSSWSASDGSNYEPFLKLTLSSIILALWQLSFTHSEGSKIMLTVKKQVIRLRHLDRLTAIMFVGVLAFGLTESKFLHFFFIILAAAGMTVRVLNYFDSKIYRIVGLVLMILAIFVWIVGFLFPFMWSIGLGETIFYLVTGFSILSQINKIE